ncbi:MAG TPA: hypothetical protein VD837_19520 [Terriglobales bacterium]|nr:hypothetical protein [Terriglobales bacterium]
MSRPPLQAIVPSGATAERLMGTPTCLGAVQLGQPHTLQVCGRYWGKKRF